MNRYIALDVETGGIGHDKSLLSAYFAILDNDFNLIDSLLINTKPNDGIYIVTAEALGINKINLVDHDKSASTYSVSGSLLRDLIRLHSNEGKNKLIPVGHNVFFDLEFVYAKLLNKKEAQKYISYRLLDTGIIAQFLKTINMMPESVTGSLSSLVKHFEIPGPETVGSALHTADGDTIMTIQVLKAMINKVGGTIK